MSKIVTLSQTFKGFEVKVKPSGGNSRGRLKALKGFFVKYMHNIISDIHAYLFLRRMRKQTRILARGVNKLLYGI